MTTRSLTLPLLAAGVIVVTVSAAADVRPTAPPPRAKRLTEAEVRRLIDRLGSEDFAEREAATEALKRRPEAAVAVRQASRTATSPEVQRRLSQILKSINHAEVNKRLARLPEYAKQRQVDRLIETMVAYREYLTPEHDAPVRALVRDIHAAATRDKKHPWTAKLPEFKSFAWQPGINPFQRQTIVDRVAPPAAWGIIASERIEGGGKLRECVALCNGDVIGITHYARTMFGAEQSIVIATGSVRLDSADGTVIVCPGDVVVSGGGSTSVIVAGGRAVAHGYNKYTIIREQDAEFFRAWKLYSVAEAGAELWSAFGVVGVRSVAPGSRFDRTGIKPGDILLQIDSASARSVRDANRLLCRATVSTGTSKLTIVRGGNRHEWLVSLSEW